MQDLHVGILELFTERRSSLLDERGEDGRRVLPRRSAWVSDRLPSVDTLTEREAYAALLQREALYRSTLPRTALRRERSSYRAALERLKTARRNRTLVKLETIAKERRCLRCGALLALVTKGLKKLYCTSRCRKAAVELRRPKRKVLRTGRIQIRRSK